MSAVTLRRVPRESPIHRLWAGTKMLAVLAISVVLMVLPTWPVLGLLATLLLVCLLVARIPAGALPRPPWWFWALLALAFLPNFVVGWPAVLRYAQITAFAALIVFTSLLIAWTTSFNEIAPAVAVLGRPLKRLRMPVDEWAVALALTLRSLPLLLEEMRVLRAARQLRPKGIEARRGARDNALVDVITAATAVAMRRAGELGEAITARGGTGQLAAYSSQPTWRDGLALLVVLATIAAGVTISLI